jgi:GNAT superfamily N-acetyltransferase
MLTLRDAVPSDASLIVSYIKELAEYERDPEAAKATEADLLKYAFSEHPLVHVVMAEWKGEPAGFALWFFNFSTWEGQPGMYLEDLFVRPAFRGFGIGKSLMQHLATLAVTRGCTRFVWQVLDWNKPSITFYEKLGAKVMHPWLTCRLEGEALTSVARGA